MVKSKKQTLLEKLGTIVGEKSKIGKLISGYRKLEEANYISSHFSAYLAPVVASSKELKNDVFTIVYTGIVTNSHYDSILDLVRIVEEFRKINIKFHYMDG